MGRYRCWQLVVALVIYPYWIGAVFGMLIASIVVLPRLLGANNDLALDTTTGADPGFIRSVTTGADPGFFRSVTGISTGRGIEC